LFAYGPELFLAGCIPNLNLKHFALMLYVLHLVVNSRGANYITREFSVYVGREHGTLAYTGIANKQQLDEVIWLRLQRL